MSRAEKKPGRRATIAAEIEAMIARGAFRPGRAAPVGDTAAQSASDARVLVTIFGSIFGGMLLMLVTAVLVFF